MQEAICRTLEMGVDIKVACAREGISDATYYHWRRLGRQGREPYAAFLTATEKALAEVEARATHRVLKDSTWQSAAWWLKWRKTGGRTQVEISGPDGRPIQLSPALAEEMRAVILFGQEPAQLPDGASGDGDGAADSSDGASELLGPLDGELDELE
jgi:Transposase